MSLAVNRPGLELEYSHLVSRLRMLGSVLKPSQCAFWVWGLMNHINTPHGAVSVGKVILVQLFWSPILIRALR
jgi:hypothetical protein